MPLILISGYPSSGKTYRSHQLITWLNTKISTSPNPHLSVHHINDESLGLDHEVYREAKTEKDARAAAYSATQRVLGTDRMVIADGMNYIKGYRYQLYCEAKAAQTPSCVIHVGTPVDKCREINTRLLQNPDNNNGSGSGYAEDLFDNLIFRYEEPNGMTRWDSPLFTVPYDDAEPPYDAIWDALIGADGRSKTVKPNKATVLTPAAPSNYFHELDQTTQEVLSAILSWQRDHPGEGGGIFPLPANNNGDKSQETTPMTLTLPTSPLSVPQLQRLRRQYVALNRQHTLPQSRVRGNFVAYLNDCFEGME